MVRSDGVYKDTMRHIRTRNITVEDGKESTLRLGDGQRIYLGAGENSEIYWDSANAELRLNNITDNKIVLQRKGNTMVTSTWDGAHTPNDLLTEGSRIRDQPTIADGEVHGPFDSAPAHEVGKMVLASPTWDPDGDGNGELVMSDGSAWQEVVDLPNYT